MQCEHCHHQIGVMEKFCSSCGQPLKQSMNIQDVKLEFYRRLIGPKNQDYYLDRFFKYDREGAVSAGWHWPAFFVTFYWLLYRKMWLNAFLYFISPIVIGFILGFILGIVAGIIGMNIGPMSILLIQGIIAILLFSIIPMFANAIYYKHINKKIDNIQQQHPDIRDQLKVAEKQGGVSHLFLIFILVFGFITMLGVAAVAIPSYQSYVHKTQMATLQQKLIPIQQNIMGYYQEHQQFPEHHQLYKLAEPFPSMVKGMMFNESGDILIEVQQTSQTTGHLIYSPVIENDQIISWTCHSENLTQNILPETCQ